MPNWAVPSTILSVTSKDFVPARLVIFFTARFAQDAKAPVPFPEATGQAQRGFFVGSDESTLLYLDRIHRIDEPI